MAAWPNDLREHAIPSAITLGKHLLTPLWIKETTPRRILRGYYQTHERSKDFTGLVLLCRFLSRLGILDPKPFPYSEYSLYNIDSTKQSLIKRLYFDRIDERLRPNSRLTRNLP